MKELINPPLGDGGGGKLGNYITGKWITGDGDGQSLYGLSDIKKSCDLCSWSAGVNNSVFSVFPEAIFT